MRYFSQNHKDRNRIVASKGFGEGATGSYGLIGVEFQIPKMNRFMGMDDGGGCTR